MQRTIPDGQAACPIRALAFSPSLYPDDNAEALVNTNLLRALSKRGIAVDVVVRRATVLQPEGFQAYCDREGRLRQSKDRAQIPLSSLRGAARRVFGWHALQTCRYAREATWAYRASSASVRYSRSQGHDLAVSFGGFCHMAAVRWASRLGRPLVANWNDPFPPLIGPPPYGRGEEARIPSVYRRLLKEIGESASWHIFCSERLRRYMLRHLPEEAEERSSVVPHMARTAQCPPARPRGPRLVITHAGGLLPFRNVDVLLESVKRLLANGVPRNSLLLRAIGPNNHLLKRAASRYGLDDLLDLVDEVRYDVCQPMLADSDILLVVEAPMKDGICLPSKLADYVQTGRPILAVSPRPGTVADYLDRCGGGIAADCRSPEEVLAALNVLYNAWLCGTLHRDYGSARLYPEFCEDRVADSYVSVFRRVLGVRGLPTTA